MAISPFYPKTPAPDVPKQYAVLNAEEEGRKTPSRRDRRANMRRQKWWKQWFNTIGTMKKVYVSIPISGEDYNGQRDHAGAVAQELKDQGYDVVTPFDIVKSVTTPYNVAMGKCVAELLECEIIYLCKGWQNSKGCSAELQIALVYGLGVMTE